MNLFLHLSIHVFFALLAGFIAFRIWRKPVVSFAGGILGGVFIDLDHLIDYFLAFGFNFKLDYFINGYQFLKSDKVYVLFHGWEYVIILMVIAVALRSLKLKSLVFALAFGAFFHLSADVIINNASVKFYSIIFRAKNRFEIEKIVTPEHWREEHQMKRKIIF